MDIKLRQGIYVYFQGPRYETSAEMKLFELLKVDAVGMSTVPEAIVANYCGINVLGLSLIKSIANGSSKKLLLYKESLDIEKRESETMSKIIYQLIRMM